MTKQITKISLILSLLIILSLPASVSSQDDELSLQACNSSGNRLNTISNSLQKSIDEYDKLAKSENSELAKSREEFDSLISTGRVDSDNKLNQDFDKFLEKHKDDGKYQLAQEYVNAVKQAILVRRQAFDEARSTFKTDLDALINQLRAQQKAAINQYKAGLIEIFDNTDTTCNKGGIDSNDIRKAFVANLKQNRLDYLDNRQKNLTKHNLIKDLVEQHQTKIREATAAFEQTLVNAKNQFGEL